MARNSSGVILLMEGVIGSYTAAIVMNGGTLHECIVVPAAARLPTTTLPAFSMIQCIKSLF